MKSSRFVIRLFFLVLSLLLVGIVVKSSRIRDKDLDYYYKEKIARRGDVRKAKENKEEVPFSQQRIGVVRTLWYDENNGIMKQFRLQAAVAFFDFVLSSPNGPHPQETFLRPNGWMQEKIGWELNSDSTEVEMHNGKWRKLRTREVISEDLEAHVQPFQVIRHYDAAKAIWDIQKDLLTLYKVHFIDYRKEDHTPSLDTTNARKILEGYAEEMTFHCKEGTTDGATSSGLKLQVEPKEL